MSAFFPLAARADANQRCSCSIRGSLTVSANRGLGALRIWVHGPAGLTRQASVHGGIYEFGALLPGTYRVELRAHRLVFARRITLNAGDAANVDFNLR